MRTFHKLIFPAVLGSTVLGLSAITTAEAGPKFLYTLHNNQALRGFSLDPTTGALTVLPGPVADVGELPMLFSMGKAPGGAFLYSVSAYDEVTFGFAVNATTGALTPVPGSPVPFPPDGIAMTVHPSGKFAYLSAVAYDISPFIVNPTTGAITASGNVATGGVYPRLGIEPKGKCLYSLNRGISFINDPSKTNNISAFTVDQTSGALTEISGSPFATGASPEALAFHPTGKFLIVSSLSQAQLRTYAIDPTACTLTQKATLSKVTGELLFEPTGRFVYASSGPTANSITELSFNATTGALTQIGTVSTGKLTGGQMAMDPSGKFLISIQSNLSGQNAPIQAASYTINATTGALSLSSGPVTIDGDSPVEDLTIAGTP
jgi:6-phosphogluconolactonase (cycloisomerase 2 family)